MRPINDLTPEEVRDMFDYDPSTGVLSYRKPAGRWGHLKPGAAAGTVGRDGYLRVNLRGKRVLAHRVALVHLNGRLSHLSIDHINGVKTDNRAENLREVEHSTNLQNLKKAKVSNAIGLLGVTRNRSKWKASLWVLGRQKHLGTFGSPEAAHAAYLAAKRIHHPGCTI